MFSPLLIQIDLSKLFVACRETQNLVYVHVLSVEMTAIEKCRLLCKKAAQSCLMCYPSHMGMHSTHRCVTIQKSACRFCLLVFGFLEQISIYFLTPKKATESSVVCAAYIGT